jgi:hypothetical protein
MRASLVPSFLALLAIAPLTRPLAAQAAAEPAGPRAGSWGGEVMFPDARVSVLRFRGSDRSAFVLSLRGSVARETRELELPFGPDEESNTNTGIGASIGLRGYAGDGRLRPVRGIGVMAAHSTSANDYRYVQAGAYAELGAHYFVTPNASLGVMGELRGYWSRSRFENGAEQRLMVVDLMLARVGGAVYF